MRAHIGAGRGLVAYGCEVSRNAGFACIGSVTELLDYKHSMTDTEILELYDWRRKRSKLRRRLGDSNIGYAANGSFMSCLMKMM